MEKIWENKQDESEKDPSGKEPSSGRAPSPVPTGKVLFSPSQTQSESFRTPRPFAVSGTTASSSSRKAFFSKGSLFQDRVITAVFHSSGTERGTFLSAPQENSFLPENPDLGVIKLYPLPEKEEEYVSLMEKLSAESREQKEGESVTPEILSFGIQEKKFCWSMTKYKELTSLESFIQAKSPMNEHKALFTIYAIASLLDRAYPRWGFHGRLKPSKILFGLKKPPLLLGAGLTPFLRKNAKEMLEGETFFYASPEYLSGGELSWRSDIYSLGIIFFRLLAGVLPFYSGDPEEVKRAHLETPLPPVSEKNPSVRISTPTRGILNRMTMKDPEKRFFARTKLLEALIQADDALPQEEKE